MINGPFGIFSTPRYSTLMPQMIRISQILLRAHKPTTVMSADRGIRKVGSAMIIQITSAT